MARLEIAAPVSGSVCQIDAVEGSAVVKGALLMVLESMKMEIPVEAPVDGTVTRILVAEKDVVKQGQTLAIISTADPESATNRGVGRNAART